MDRDIMGNEGTEIRGSKEMEGLEGKDEEFVLLARSALGADRWSSKRGR